MELKETFVSRQEIFHGRIVDLRVDTYYDMICNRKKAK